MQKSTRLRLFAAICLILVFSSSAIAQTTKEIKFRHTTVDNGLASNNVRALLQDKYGYIWIGTDYGINRYDGHTILTPRGSKAKASILSLCEYGDTIWIGTNDGLAYYSHRSDSISLMDKKTKDGTAISTIINNIMADKDGNLWIATYGQGVFLLRRNGELKQYILPGNNTKVGDIIVTKNEEVWAYNNWDRSYITRLNKRKDVFETVKVKDTDNIKDVRLGGIAIAEDKNGLLWIGSWNSGLITLDPLTLRANVIAKSDDKHLRHIHWITVDNDNAIYVSSDDGLSIYNQETATISHYKEDELNPYSLVDKFVYPVLKDKEGGLWVGTYYGGLEYAHPGASNFTNHIQSSYRNSVSGNIISNFREDNNGIIWIASDDGGLSSYNKVTKQFTSYENNSGEKRNIHGMCVSGDNLYLGTYTTGMDILNTKTGATKHYPKFYDKNGKDYGTSSYSIMKSNDGRIWVGTFSEILIFDEATGTFSIAKETNAIVVDMDEDKKGNLWFCADADGVYRYNIKSKKWDKYDTFTTSDTGNEATNVANSLYIDDKGTVWLGGSKGLFKYDDKKNAFTFVKTMDKEPNVQGVTGEGDNLWIATLNGIVLYSTKNSAVVRTYKSNDGLDNTGFIQNSIFKGKDGYIYIGTSHGFTSFNPSKMKNNVVEPKVVFTDLELFNKHINIGSEYLPDNLNKVNAIEFSHNENSIRVSFSAMSYLMPENNMYQYYLEGYESAWNDPTNENYASYTNLSPGTYILHVRAANNDGIWNNDDVTLTIIINPPFYWNTPVKILYFLILIGIIYAIIRYFLNKKEEEHIAEIQEINTMKETEVHEARIKFMTISDSDNQFLKRLEDAIEQNFSNPDMSVDFLASKMNISRSGLFAKVKTLADVTPNEMIQIIRLKHAARLLESKQYRVNEICYMVGFNSPSYFTKCFTKHYGVKPAEYNKQQINNNTEENEKEPQ